MLKYSDDDSMILFDLGEYLILSFNSYIVFEIKRIIFVLVPSRFPHVFYSIVRRVGLVVTTNEYYNTSTI